MSIEVTLKLGDKEIQLQETSFQEEEPSISAEERNRQKIEDAVLEMVRKMEKAKELSEEIKRLKEDVHDWLGEDYEPMVFALPNGMFATVQKKYSSREKLNKGALADAVGIDKDELKTPYDFSALTQKQVLNPELIQDFMTKEPKTAVSVKKVKRDPLKKGRRGRKK